MYVLDEPLLIKSKLRVQKHGEVFTPRWVVDRMISVPGIEEKIKDVFATFLEPSAGEGAFLLAVENSKLRFVLDNFGKEDWNTYALWALTSIYGIEFLNDNLNIARRNMLLFFTDFYETVHGYSLPADSDLYKSAQTIIWANIVQGDTLTLKTGQGNKIMFSRWKRMPNAEHMVLREVFSYSSMVSSEKEDAYVQESLFEMQPTEEEPSHPKYLATDILQIWKEEKAHGR